MKEWLLNMNQYKRLLLGVSSLTVPISEELAEIITQQISITFENELKL